TSAMKPTYKTKPRFYPQVLVALVLNEREERVLGAVFLEAPKERQFRGDDVAKVLGRLGEGSSLLLRAIRNWEPRLDSDCENQDLSGVVVNPGSDMSRWHFTNARLEGVTFDDVLLYEAVLNGAQCKDAQLQSARMISAQIIGTTFAGACFAGA